MPKSIPAPVIQSVSFSVPGAQVPQARARVTRNGTYNPRNTWRESIQWIASQHFKGWPLEGRKRVDVVMYGGTMRADMDNLLKAVLDALQGHAFRNDNQVDDARIRRVPFKGEPTTSITVSLL